ncbi:LacI family transcriptional regulator [Sphingomonas koreensis]|nr:LacI family transcriptional regulator [Sphingomonas koreensis]
MTGPGKIRSMAELAALAGLSSSTISRALSGHWSINEQTRERVQALAQEHGYKPNQLARNLRLQRTQAIGLVLPLGHETGQHLTDPFFLTLLGHLADELVARDYELTLSRVIPHDDQWLDRVVDSGRIDGLILIGQSDQMAVIERVAARYRPLVIWGASLPGSQQMTVGSDNREGGRLAARHLIDIGRKRLLFLGNIDPPEFAQRLAGFRSAVEAAEGVSGTVEPLHMTFDDAYAGVADYLARHGPPDGIVAASDVVAISAMRALAEAGFKTPEDVAVVGYDDVTLAAHTMPGITTIRQDIAIGARMLVEMLFDRIAGRPTQPHILTPELIIRGSTRGER